MKNNGYLANSNMIAGMGGYGCIAYDCSGSTMDIEPAVAGRHIAVIQAYEDTTISATQASWDAPADIAGLTIPAGQCLFVKAAKVTITGGSGVAYYGDGIVTA